jgi:hypothetical protein
MEKGMVHRVCHPVWLIEGATPPARSAEIRHGRGVDHASLSRLTPRRGAPKSDTPRKTGLSTYWRKRGIFGW